MANTTCIRLWCIHGNLQTPEVWTAIGDRWWHQLSINDIQLERVNVWESEAQDCWQWGLEFNQQVRHRAQPNEAQWLMGYSLGGRLAMHALLDDLSLWTGCIAIAADPGIDNTLENAATIRKACQQRDRDWGQRFLNEPWALLLQEWDRQPVFGRFPCSLNRPESHYDRQCINRLFQQFSKGRQDDLRPLLSGLTRPPILFISGQEDAKYTAIGEELDAIGEAIVHVNIPSCGHRVPWENSEAFIAAVKNFVNSAKDQPQ